MSLKVLLLSRNYPNSVIPFLGLWVEGLAQPISRLCEARVVSPVPYCPPLPTAISYARYRRIPMREQRQGIPVHHPRFVTGPGYSLHNIEASTYYWSIYRSVDHLRREFPFDLIHAHFTYPDGVVAARLGQKYGVPVVITEHAPWLPWLETNSHVRRQALWASRICAFHLPVSRYVQDTIEHFAGPSSQLRVVPVGVDGSVFRPLPPDQPYNPKQILYVGFMRQVKGVDVLLKAMRQLVNRVPDTQLVLVGGGFYSSYQREEARLQRLTGELGLEAHVKFVGMKSSAEVARLMRESALLVLPSRAESFGAVLVEALACGTPVVATRCGGPEDIVNEQVGVLVPKEDDWALASAMEYVLAHREQYAPAALRSYALANFAWERIAERTVHLYHEALSQRATPHLMAHIN